ncbi:M3 family metallopeptidase [Martelella mediterranea]|uniref:Peptidyl-dipeptidase dcp n=1 Tax=Martelella mediterranea DSM 17316 TaxID=1122214 RepID=A0A1U9YXI5_9HYPH|nr:M3 family metallopeptidase [Martelella mediterranea]AQZ50155.1 Peptidyl-dipeptidase dcp [Martelella mediterranea DSM 17316]
MTDTINSALIRWEGFAGLPEFDRIADGDFTAAFDWAMADHNREIDAIAANPDAPDFANTVDALEVSGDALSRVSAVFFTRAGADTNPEIQKIEREIVPKLSSHYSAIGANKALFQRIDTLWQAREGLGLTGEQWRVLERHWKGFVRSGAQLEGAEQERLAAVNRRLAELGAAFGQNVLADESDWAMFLTQEDELAGLPDFLIDAMAGAASERGREGAYAVTLSRSIVEPFLTLSARRDLREKAFKAWTARGLSGGEHDNRDIMKETLALRAEKAALLGYENFAALKLDNTMAKTANAVDALLMDVWEKAVKAAAADEAELRELAAEEGYNGEIEAWDWRYYAEKLKARKFDFSESEVKPYLQLEKIIEACFAVAERLFGIRAVAKPDVKAYHPDVRVYEIRNADDELIALFLGDYFNRTSKRSGAWMNALQSQHRLTLPNGEQGEIPIVINVCNFAKPAAGKPALLSLDDARTLFHEFGHALHGMLSDVTYPSVSGTGVDRDFVELPSQLYEHWLTTPEVLKTYALHAETGEAMPEALMDKVLSAATFGQAFATVEYTACAIVDMRLHTAEHPPADPVAFQDGVLNAIGMPKAIAMRHAIPHFLHIFAGDGYSAGYYSYMWSEVLDADAFEAFEEAGNVFDPATAGKLKSEILTKGGSVAPEAAYQAFRGRMPGPEAMLKGRGLV